MFFFLQDGLFQWHLNDVNSLHWVDVSVRFLLFYRSSCFHPLSLSLSLSLSYLSFAMDMYKRAKSFVLFHFPHSGYYWLGLCSVDTLPSSIHEEPFMTTCWGLQKGDILNLSSLLNFKLQCFFKNAYYFLRADDV